MTACREVLRPKFCKYVSDDQWESDVDYEPKSKLAQPI